MVASVCLKAVSRTGGWSNASAAQGTGRPRAALRVGGQLLTIENELLTCDITWPGVPGDSLTLDAGPVDDDLMSLLERIEHEGEDDYDEADEDDWDDDGEA